LRIDVIPVNQRRFIFDLVFTLNHTVDMRFIDDWIGASQLVAPEIIWPGPLPRASSKKQKIDDVLALLSRALLVSANLQIAARVPCFEAGEIVKLSPKPGHANQWLAKVAIVVPNGISEKIAIETLNASIRLLLFLNQSKPDANKSQAIFKELEQKLVKRTGKMISGGKSTIPILFAAYRNDIPFCHLGSGIYQLGWGSKARIIDRSSLDLDSYLGANLTENKMKAVQMLHAAGMPAPNHYMVQTLKAAQEAAKKLGWPVVIKPANLNRGEGVTIDIDCDEKLETAFNSAAKLTKQILVEKQIEGICHRILIINETFIYAIKRNPKSVQGNGELTLQQLFEKETSEQVKIVPWKRRKPIIFDEKTKEFISSQGYQLDTVVPKDIYVYLRKIESTSWGSTPEDLTDKIHPSNVDLAIRAARLFRLSVCGVDILSSDITKPWFENNAKIIELNFAPLFALDRGAYHDNFIKLLFKGSSRIPIEVIESSTPNPADEARRAQNRRIENGERCYLVLNDKVFRPDGVIHPLLGKSPQDIVQKLLLDRAVDSIVVNLN
jgi:cyanophycin synthetase